MRTKFTPLYSKNKLCNHNKDKIGSLDVYSERIEKRKGMLAKLKLFLEESRQELKRVNWPRREQTIRYTMFVIGLSLALALFLGFIDFIFTRILKTVLIN